MGHPESKSIKFSYTHSRPSVSVFGVSYVMSTTACSVLMKVKMCNTLIIDSFYELIIPLQILQRSQHEVMALQAESRTLEAEKRQLMVRRKRLFNEFTMGLKVTYFRFPAQKKLLNKDFSSSSRTLACRSRSRSRNSWS